MLQKQKHTVTTESGTQPVAIPISPLRPLPNDLWVQKVLVALHLYATQAQLKLVCLQESSWMLDNKLYQVIVSYKEGLMRVQLKKNNKLLLETAYTEQDPISKQKLYTDLDKITKYLLIDDQKTTSP